MSVAVSMASQCPPITTLPKCGMRSAECGMDRALVDFDRSLPGSNHPVQFRTPHSAFHIPEGSWVASPNLLQLPGVGIRTVTEAEVPIQPRRPRPRALGPFDQHDGFVAHHVVEPQILDRKSTRLNSCHVRISYAVFC